MATKTAIIGGGSIFAAGIITTLLDNKDEAEDTLLVLQDPDEKRAEVMRDLGRGLARKAGVKMRIEFIPDLDKAIEGADFVVTCFRIGGFEALKLDEEIPRRHGQVGQEMEGVGGLFLGQRSIPVVVDIAKRMEKLCPDAWMVNYANPTALLADAVHRTSSIKEVSVCDGPCSSQDFVAEILGSEFKDLFAYIAGVNHCTWVVRVLSGDRDVTDKFHEAIARVDRSAVSTYGQKLLSWYDILGYVPGPQGHMRVFYWLADTLRAEKTRTRWSVYSTYASEQQIIQKHFEELAKADDPVIDTSLPRISHYVGSVSDLAIEIVLAIMNDSNKRFTLNYPNSGIISNMPDDVFVEGPARINRTSVQPMEVGEMPGHLLPTLVALAQSRKLAVEAALEGNREALLHSIICDPTIMDLTTAKALMDEMLEANAKWLPQYS